jgi:hypothetical protein
MCTTITWLGPFRGLPFECGDEFQAQGFVSSLEASSQNAHVNDLIRAVLGAAFYPQFGQLISKKGQRFAKVMTSSKEKVRALSIHLNIKFN